MKNTLTITIAAVGIVAFAQDAATVSANATLKDGSTVKGELLSKRIAGSTLFAEQLDLAPALVKSLSFSGTNGESKVELANGDKFAMTVANEKFKIKSLLGELAIPRANFRSISLSQRKVSAGGEDGLVFYCTFDDEAAITSPAVGPNGIFQIGEFTEGKNGQALYLPAYTSGAKFPVPEGMIGPAGTIEFWAKVNDLGHLTDGGCPRFFIVFSQEPRGEISQDWSANNGSGGSGLTFRIDGLPVMASSNSMESLCDCLGHQRCRAFRKLFCRRLRRRTSCTFLSALSRMARPDKTERRCDAILPQPRRRNAGLCTPCIHH